MALLVSNEYLPASYDIALEILPTKPNFTGRCSFLLVKNKNFNGEKPGFKLNAKQLVILDASIDGTKVAVETDRQNEHLIFGADALREGGVVTINYMGSMKTLNSFEQTMGLFRFEVDERTVISSQSQPVFSRLIYPNVDDPAFKAPINLAVTTLSQFTVLSNNALKSKSQVNDTLSQFVFEQTPPILSSNFAVTIGDLEYTEVVDSIPIRVYHLKEFALSAQNVIKVAAKLFPILESHLGPFPLKKLDIVGIPYLTEGAMENWGLITVMQDHLFKGDDLQTQQLISHEMVHQWIGNLVSFSDWKCLWLNESFATFFGNYFVTKINKKYSMVEEWLDIHERVLKMGDTNIQKWLNKLVINDSITTSYLFNHQVYEKGILILRMIGNILDPSNPDNYDVFLKGMKSFIEARKFQSIAASEIWQYFLSEFDIDLLTFYNIWTRYDKFPTLQIAYKEDNLVIDQAQSRPFHFPLVIKTTTNTYQVYITEKSTKVKLPLDTIVVINRDKISLAKSDISKKITKSIDTSALTSLDAKAYLVDYPDQSSDLNKKLQKIYHPVNNQ